MPLLLTPAMSIGFCFWAPPAFTLKFAEQPIHEDSLLTGALEPTNEWYAIAKIAGIKLGAGLS